MTINKFQGRTREEAVDKAKKEMGEAVESNIELQSVGMVTA